VREFFNAQKSSGLCPEPRWGTPPDPQSPEGRAQKRDPSALTSLPLRVTLSVLIFFRSYEVSILYYFQTRCVRFTPTERVSIYVP
jgi:hypothetical protein